MNIFFLDKDPNICATYHCDKHVLKMIVEYAQILSTAHRVLDGKKVTIDKKVSYVLHFSFDDRLYKATHINHPSSLWARQSLANYITLYNLFVALCDEYVHRYGKIHATDFKLRFALANIPKNIPIIEGTDPPLIMTEDIKVEGDAVQSYRNCYNWDKFYMCSWKKRPIPTWFKGEKI